MTCLPGWVIIALGIALLVNAALMLSVHWRAAE